MSRHSSTSFHRVPSILLRAGIVVATAFITLRPVMAPATDGINLVGIGPVQEGTGGAGAASGKNATWTSLNPAGLTQVPSELDLSLQLFAPDRTVDSTASGGAGKQEDDSTFYIPTVGTAFRTSPEARGVWGVMLYGSCGMGVNYETGRIGPPGGQSLYDQRTDLSVAKTIAAYALELDNGLSLGAGPILVFSRLRTDMFNAAGQPQEDTWDEAYGGGAVFGLTQRLGKRLRVGAAYTTEQPVEEFDTYQDLLGGSLNLPQELVTGVAVKLSATVEAVLDYRWIGWGELDTFGDTFGWDSQNVVKAGVTWQAADTVTLRGGVSHGNSPIDSGNAFSNTLFPAIMQTHLTTGLSITFDAFDLDVTYVHALKEEIEANGADTGGFGAGTRISMVQNSLTLGTRMSF